MVDQNKTAQNSTDSYATLLKAQITDCDSVTIIISNSHGSNSLTAEILVSNDPAGSAASYAALAVTEAGAVEVPIAHDVAYAFDLPLYRWYDVKVKSTTPSSAGIANVWLHAR